MTRVSLLRSVLILTLSSLLPSLGSCKPPTVDPTYGEHPSRLISPEQNRPVDKWIWVDQTIGDQTVYARALLTLPTAPRSAAISITADDAFTLFVNGQTVDATEPVEQGWKQAHTRPITALLHAGRNVIAVRGTNRGGGAAGILLHLEVDHKPALQSDKNWRVLAAPEPPANWTSPSFNDSHWVNATELAGVGEGPWGTGVSDWPGNSAASWYLAHKTIRPRALYSLTGQFDGIEAAVRTGTVKVVVQPVVATASPASLLIDFGQELAGRLSLRGAAGAHIRVTTGEVKEECFHEEPALDNRGPFSLTLSATDPSSTPYTAFRYALLTFPDRKAATLTSIECDHKYYPVTYKGTFACSDPLLTKIWYAGAYTAHLCMQEEIWDAPKRDRGLWCGDLHVTGATINDVFADRFLMERSIAGLRKIAQEGRSSDLLPTQEINGLPGYTAAWFCELADYYRHSGNDEFLRSQHKGILTLLEFQQTDFDAQHLFVNPRKNWNFVDWAPDFVLDSPQSHMATDLFDIQGVHEAVFLLRSLSDEANAARFDAWASTLTAAARQQYIDPATMTFGDRLQPNIMAIYSGVATPAQKKAIYEGILRAGSPAWTPHSPPVNLDGYPMSPYYGYYLLHVLGEIGRTQKGIDLIRRYWGDMMRRGGATLWEKFDPAMPEDEKAILDRMPYLSFCHGWSSGPTPFLSEYILGVRPTSGGMKTVEITPFLGDLAWAEGDVPAPSGLIHIKVSRRVDGQAITLTLPSDVDAQLGLAESRIKVDRASSHVMRTERGLSFVRLHGPGVYHVSATR